MKTRHLITAALLGLFALIFMTCRGGEGEMRSKGKERAGHYQDALELLDEATGSK